MGKYYVFCTHLSTATSVLAVALLLTQFIWHLNAQLRRPIYKKRGETGSGTFYPHQAPPAMVQQYFMYQQNESRLPFLEDIHNCQCPRVYIPVCGTDNKSYINHCWLNCMNVYRLLTVKVTGAYGGACLQDYVVSDYDKFK